MPHCPKCGKVIIPQTIDQIVDSILALPERTRIQIMSPVARGRKGEYVKTFENARKNGFVRAKVDGEMIDITENQIRLDKQKKHNISIVVDRLVVKEGISKRLTDSVETALNMAGGLVMVDVLGDEPRELMYSQNYACDDCGVSLEELSPRMFSFNTPYGACPSCMGIGTITKIDPNLIIPDKRLSINQGAIVATGWSNAEANSIASMYYEGLAEHYGFDLDTPVEELPEQVLNALLYGTNGEKIKLTYNRKYSKGIQYASFEGIINNLERRHQETSSEWMKAEIESYMMNMPCPECGGTRLKKESLAVTINDKNINDVTNLSIDKAYEFFSTLNDTLSEKNKIIAKHVLKEINDRLKFLKDVGLEYLTLSRSAGTLSGGEAQRIRLATQIGSSLMGVVYILDEPSIGLHQRDNDKLIDTLKNLRDLGNTLIVVEHDEDTMLAADHIIDIGPGAGIHGGEVVACGTPQDIMDCKESITGQYLSGAKKIPIPKTRRKGNGHKLEIFGASENNLKNINVKIPLGTFTVVTGVSGSGKSSLVNEIIYKHLSNQLNGSRSSQANSSQ